MPILSPLYAVYNSLFAPLLTMGGLYTGALLTIGLISAVLAVFLTFLYKWLTDVEERDRLKERAKEFKEKADEARKNDNEEKMQKYMEQSMAANKDMFKMNLKPMAASFAIVIFIFPWLSHVFTPTAELTPAPHQNNTFNGQFTYQGETVNLTAEQVYIEEIDETRFTLKSQDMVVAQGKLEEQSPDRFTLSSVEKSPLPLGSSQWEVKNLRKTTNTESKVSVKLSLITYPADFPLVGNVEWLGFYILISVPLTFGLRKLFGVA